MITCSSTVFPVLFFLTLNVECHNTNILSKCVSKGKKQKHVGAPVHTDSCWKRDVTLVCFRRTAAPCWSSWGRSWHRRRGSCRWWRQEQRSSAHSDSRITCCKARCINTSLLSFHIYGKCRMALSYLGKTCVFSLSSWEVQKKPVRRRGGWRLQMLLQMRSSSRLIKKSKSRRHW